MSTFAEQFRNAVRCSIPLISARSADPIGTVQSILGSLNGKLETIPVMQWDVLRGISGVNKLGKEKTAELLSGQDASQVSARPTDCLGLISVDSFPEDSLVLMHNLHMFWDDKVVMQGILNLRDKFKNCGASLVGLNLTGSVIPPELSEHTLTIDEPLPTSSELAEVTRRMFADYTERFPETPKPDDSLISQSVDATQGLSGFAAEQSISLNLSKTGLDIRGTWKRKKQTIESDGLLKVYEGPESFQTLGGNEGFKTFNTALFNGNEAPRAAILMDELEKAVSSDSGNSTKTELIGLLLSWFQNRKIDGQLMNGVPGSGKTAGVKAIGNQFNVPVILFDLASMQNQFIGNSQKRLVTALDRIDAMCNGKPCVYATTNKLEAISAELRARFKLGTFFFDLPSELERAAIWNIYTAKWDCLKGMALPDSNGWTGREIEECCYKAYRLNISLVDSARYIVPVSRSSADSIKTLRLQASGKFLSASDSGLYRYEETAPVSSSRKFRE